MARLEGEVRKPLLVRSSLVAQDRVSLTLEEAAALPLILPGPGHGQARSAR